MTKNKNSLMARIAEKCTIKEASVLSESKFFDMGEPVRTPIPGLNLAFSGSLKGGFFPGVTVLAGESKSFKTTSALVAISSFLKMYKEQGAVCIYIDTEFGAPPAYIKAAGIDLSQVFHIPVVDAEQMKTQVVRILDELTPEDKVILFIDSIGNVASKKEVENAENENTAADFTRAKSLKAFFRIITPRVKIRKIPCFVINHTYKTIGMFPTDVTSGGTGSVYAADTIIIITKAKDKKGDEVVGNVFTYNIAKGRYTKEGSKIYITVSYKDGVSRFSGLLDLALDSGHVVSPSKGWYSRRMIDKETGEVKQEDKKWRRSDTDSMEFWKPIMGDETFHTWIEDNYKIAVADLVDEDFDENSEDIDDTDLSEDLSDD